MLHSSTLTMVQTAIRAPFGSVQRRRPTIGEESKRSCGSFTGASLNRPGGPDFDARLQAAIVQSSPVTPPPGIDIHAHFFPESYLRLIEKEGAAAGARLDRTNSAGPVIVIAGAPTPPLEPAFTDLELRLKAMNRTGIAVQALSLTVPMVYFAGGGLAKRPGQTFNDAIAETHTAHPHRL